MTSVKFGLLDENEFNTNSATINTFYPINHHEYLATTRSGLFKFEGDIIKKIYPFKLATSIIIPEYKFIVGVSSLGGEISVMLIDELENPVFSHFKTDQLNIFHIIYSSRSHSLITVGSGIKVWNFNVKMPRKITLTNRPEISITLRAQIAPNYNTPILNPPSIDYAHELLYLPTSNGFCGFDLNGNEKKLFSKVDSTAQTAASLCLENKKFITSSQGDGFHLWNQKGYLVKKIPGGMSSILALRFINKHFALFLDSNFWIFIIDIKTSNFFHCYTISSKPNYFNVYQDSYNKKHYLIISQGCTAKKFEIILPWTVWKKMTTQPYSIRRCPKFKEAARILTYYKSSIFSFLSPKDGKNLTSAVDTQPSGPIFHYYDRGLFLEPIFDESNSYVTHTNVVEIFPESKRDVLFVTTAEANTSMFSTGNNPCKLEKIIEIQVSSIAVCELNGTFMYCFSNSQGELLFYNYSDFSRHCRKLILKKPIKRIFYHRKSSSILIVFQDEVHRFDLKSFKDVQRIRIKDGSYSEFYGNLLLIGCKNGNIESFRIDFLRGTTNYRLNQITDDCIHYHDDEVTSFSFSPTFFVSSSLDKTVKIWNYSFNLLFDIIFPFPLFSCEILNAQRDILVGTDNEILKIEGTSLFGQFSTEKEIEEIDNYDKISDELTNQLIQFAVEKNKDEQSDFLSNRNKKKDDENSIQKVESPNKKNKFDTTILNENNDKKNSKQNQNNTEISEEERNRRLYEMNLINERSDNEKLQAKLRAEMKMKMEEEERKRKLKEEAEEEARRKEKMNNEEEEEDKNEKINIKKKKRRKIRNQTKTEEQKISKNLDDFDDLLFKPKKKPEKVENSDENLFQRPKAVYKPKPSGPRPSRPFRTNNKQNQNDKNDEKSNENYDYYDYEEEDGEVTKYDSEKVEEKSVMKNNRRKKMRHGAKINNKNSDNELIDETNKRKKKSKNKNKKSGKKKGDGFDNNDNDDGGSENENIDYDEEEEEAQDEGQIEENEIERSNFDVDLENKYVKIGSEANNNKNLNKDEDTNNNGINSEDNDSKSIPKKPLKAEIDTQTTFPMEKKNKFDNADAESNGKKKGTVITKRRIQQALPQENTTYEKSKKEKSDNQSNSHSNKKRSETTQKSNKVKSNLIEENRDNKEKKNIKDKTNHKENKNNKNERDTHDNNNNNNNINNEKKLKQNAIKGRQKYKREQIFLSERFKRVPTPPPEKKIFYNRNPINGSNINSKTLNPNKPLLLFKRRNPLRRSRTPPIFDQEKLVLLPGPEIVLDREVIIDKILDGKVELMPLLRRLNSDNRSYYIQKLKQSYFKHNETSIIPQSQPSYPPQIHDHQFDFSSTTSNEKDNQQNTFFKSNKDNENNQISPQSSYPPPQFLQQPSKYYPILPNIQNLNPRKNTFQKDDILQIPAWKTDIQSQNQEIDNPTNQDFSSHHKEKQQKKPQPRQQQVSILNIGFDPQFPTPPLNFSPKREITLPNLNRQGKNGFVSPRRNQPRYQRQIPIFDNNGYNDDFTKSSENFSKSKIGPLPQFEKANARHGNRYQKPIFFGMRSSSPPPLYRPKLLGRTQNNARNKNFH